jgi:hypothetical protein
MKTQALTIKNKAKKPKNVPNCERSARSYESRTHQPGWKAVASDWNFWQIFGKSVFDGKSPVRGRVRIAAYLLMI